jgi:hypothetical protein
MGRGEEGGAGGTGNEGIFYSKKTKKELNI